MNRTYWKCWLTVSLLALCACTSLRPVEMSSEQLQEQLRRGELVQVGDRIKLVHSDGRHIELTVSAIDSESIAGKHSRVAISDIVTLETREVSTAKTSTLIGGSMLWMLIILLSIPAIVVL